MSVPSSALEEVFALLGAQTPKSEVDNEDLLRSLLHSGNQDPLVDSALAVLGFSNSAVQQSINNISGKTLITVLSALISCGSKSCFSQLQPSSSTSLSSCFTESQQKEILGDEHMCCGGPFSLSTTIRIMEESLSFLKGTALDDSLVLELLEVLVKVFCMTSTFKSRLVGSCLLYERDGQQEETPWISVTTSTFIDQLIQFALEKRDVIYNRFSPMTRLLLWRLQPDLLVGDLSALLQVVAARPLLSLKNEFRHRQEWHNLIIAMAFGPDMFMEGRQLLNSWLLTSGAPCIWELKGELGATIRDVLEHPLSWDLSMDVGVILPPLSAFYHDRLHLPFIILNQPPSWAGLKELVSFLEKKNSQDIGCSVSSTEEADHLDKDLAKNLDCETATNYRNLALQDSLWMLLMDFPAWLQFASLTLFQMPKGFHEGLDNSHGIGCAYNKGQSSSDGPEHMTGSSHQEIAARYIAWHFSPQDQKLRDLVVRMLTQMAQSWLCIKDDKSPRREDKREVPAVKRRKLMDAREMYCDEPGRKDALCHTDSFKDSTEAVQKWLINFQDCCHLLDSYNQGGPPHIAATANKHQAKRRLVMGEAVADCALPMEQESRQPETTSSQCKRSSFFDTFPLVALLCSPHLHNDAVVHLILHVIMTGSGFSSMKTDVSGVMETRDVSARANDSFAYQEARKGLACREPSHRTEDFRDICQAAFCLNFSLHISTFAASGAARVFRFLEILDLLENSLFVNGCNGLGWLGDFKKIIARQLQMCISRWCQQIDDTCLMVLDDLQHRAALWAARTGLESKSLRAFNQVLQGLDILIASSVVGDDTLADA